MRLLAAALAVGAAMIMAGCSTPEPAPPTPAPVMQEAAPVPSAPIERRTANSVTTAHVLVVDAGGKPLAGMGPIATRKPNAFDEPVARGELTGADGVGVLQAPSGEYLYVRAWDPKLRYFAMNYYDLPPSEGGETEPMTVQMREAAAFRVRAVGKDGAPLPGVEIRAMLEHPKAGPWWPAQGTTNGDGVAVFQPVPPGQYKVLVNEGEAVIESVVLMPGEMADSGSVTLGQ